MRGGAVLDRPDVAPRADDGGGVDADDWFAVEVEAFVWSCGFEGRYIVTNEHPHKIIVWLDADDPNMCRIVEKRREERDEQPQPVPYEQAMGACVSYYTLVGS